MRRRALGTALAAAERLAGTTLITRTAESCRGLTSAVVRLQLGTLSQVQRNASRCNSAPSWPPAASALMLDQRRGMFIRTSETPNPESLMFLPGQPVMEGGGGQLFANARASMSSPLAKKLFAIDGVTSVFFGSDFVTVSKSEDYTWSVLKPDIFAAILEFYSSGEPLISDASTLSASNTAIHEDDDEVVAMIKELLETRIRPAVQEDGGDINYISFDPDSGTVTVKMVGACDGCPSSQVTLKSGIESMLSHYIPEVKHVVEGGPDVVDHENLAAFSKLEHHLST